MENTYGIGIANRYALFLNDDDTDPLEMLKSKEQEKELKKKTKVAEKENKVKPDAQTKVKTGPAQRKGMKETQNAKPQEKREAEKPKNGPQKNNDIRTDRNVKFSNENREERNNKRNRDEKPFNGSANVENRFANSDGFREERPARREYNRGGASSGSGGEGESGGGDGGPRGPRTGGVQGARPRQPRTDGPRRNFEGRGGKREFDRQSGSDKTGVKAVDKRDGAGAHNWGSHKDDIEEANKTIDPDQTWDTEKTDSAPETKEGGESATEGGGEGGPAAPAEEEVRELTLDEWKAQRAAKTHKPQYNLRKAGEGEDLSQWKNMYELNKKREMEEEESEEEEYDASEYPQRVGRQKHVLDIEVRFTDGRRSGPGGRGSRGGGAGRGGPRPGPRRENVAKSFRNNDDMVSASVTAEEAGRVDKNISQRHNRQSAPKVDDEHDFPSLG